MKLQNVLVDEECSFKTHKALVAESKTLKKSYNFKSKLGEGRRIVYASCLVGERVNKFTFKVVDKDGNLYINTELRDKHGDIVTESDGE